MRAVTALVAAKIAHRSTRLRSFSGLGDDSGPCPGPKAQEAPKCDAISLHNKTLPAFSGAGAFREFGKQKAHFGSDDFSARMAGQRAFANRCQTLWEDLLDGNQESKWNRLPNVQMARHTEERDKKLHRDRFQLT
jgi:hypothetical protein